MEIREIEEGKVRLFVPRSEKISSEMEVFYNPEKEFDRNISILFLSAFRNRIKRKLIVCDLLTATGVRGVRFACEVDEIDEVVLNDANPKAYELARKNVELNKDRIKCKVTVSNSEANRFLYSIGKRFDYIDVDPFGSPNSFLNSAILSLRRYGALGITSTDTAPLCGTYPLACLRKYGSISRKTEYYGEIGLRILAKKVIEVGAQYDLALTPLFSFFGGSYFRLYCQLDYGARRADALLKEIGFIRHCDKCLHRELVPYQSLELKDECSFCGSKTFLIGPLFLGPLWDEDLCEKMIAESEGKMRGFLELILSESAIHEVTYYTTDSISETLKVPEPRINKVLAMLRKMEFKASRTHFSSKGLRTNAKIGDIGKVFKEVTRG